MKLIKTNENKPGYKETKVGWIPEDWECTRLGNIAIVLGGNAFSSSDSAQSGIRWLKIANVGVNKVVWDETDYLPQAYLEMHSLYSLVEGDVVLALTRPILNGKLKLAVITSKDVPCLLNQRVARLQSTQNSNLRFIYYLCQRSYFIYLMNVAMAGTDPPNIGFSDLKCIPVPFPPPPEQKKIVAILSTWDKAIENYELLIKNYELRKKGLMQKLLTGKMRFKEFQRKDAKTQRVKEKAKISLRLGDFALPAGWKEVRLGEVAKIMFSNVDKKRNSNEPQVLLCNYTDVYYNNYITHDIKFMKATASRREIEKFSITKGDVIITKDSETQNDIAVSTIVIEKFENVLCGYHLAIIRANRNIVLGEFINSLFNLHQVRYYFSTLANGVTRFGLNNSSVNHVVFKIPSIEEQRKIASVLSTCDKEIELLKQQKSALEQQKKGLMQKLLTGQARVNVD